MCVLDIESDMLHDFFFLLFFGHVVVATWKIGSYTH